jgi:hypothetical protein
LDLRARCTWGWLFLSHPEALPVRHPQDFPAIGTEIDIALPQETLQFPAPELGQFFGAMRAYRIHIILFFDWQHARMLLFLYTSILQLIHGKFKESNASGVRLCAGNKPDCFPGAFSLKWFF